MLESIVSYGLAVGAVYALIGITYNTMFSASRVMSFTAGQLGMLGGVLGSLFILRLGLPSILGFVLTLAACAVVGVVTEVVAVRPVLGKLDQHLLQQYNEEGHLLSCLLILSFLVIVISCIGLMAYTSYIIRMALKDIAIRRIIGAGFGDIWGIYQGMFGFLLVIGLAAVIPVSWYFLDRWLEQFAYHVVLRPSDYGIAAAAMAVIVGLVLGYYVGRSVRTSPAKIIREK